MRGGGLEREDHEFMLGRVVFNVPVRHLSGDFEEAVWGFGSRGQRRNLGYTYIFETCVHVGSN